MKLLITGASGFLGEAVVRAAVKAGYDITALVRPNADVRFADGTNVKVIRGDLRQPHKWCQEVAGVEVVVHLAAAVSGDLPQQFSGTVVATENLLDALPLASLRRFVHVSSFSVYDFAALPGRNPVTEGTPIEPSPELRDAYTTTKILQELLVRKRCEEFGIEYVVLRPGAIYGPGKNWDFGRAFALGRFDIVLSPNALFRLTYIDNCASAVTKAIDARVVSGSTFNIVDDELPTHREYHALCGAAGAPTGFPVLIPWVLLSTVGRIVDLYNRSALGGRARLPEVLSYRRQQARWKPLTYPNDVVKRALDWTPSISLREGVRNAISTRSPQS